MNPTTQLAPLRKAIDVVDREVMQLLSERMRLSRRIGDIKRRCRLSIYDARREQALLDQLRQTLGDDDLWLVIQPVMAQILAGSRQLQETLIPESRIDSGQPSVRAMAYFGNKDSYTSKMAEELCPEFDNKISFDSFEAVVDAVAEGHVLKGVVPVENSSTGVLIEVLDLIYEKPVRVTAEAWQSIDHCLMGLPGTTLADIQTVLSHEQPLKQCRRFLKVMGIQGMHGGNSSACVETVAKKRDRHLGAIGSREAGERHGLVVLADRICDYAINQTRFVVLEKADNGADDSFLLDCGEAETDSFDPLETLSLAIKLKHEPGQLAKFLEPFSTYGINLIRLHSRPLPSSPREYLFFVDFEGSISSKEVRNAVSKACSHASDLKWMGGYKRSELARV